MNLTILIEDGDVETDRFRQVRTLDLNRDFFARAKRARYTWPNEADAIGSLSISA